MFCCDSFAALVGNAGEKGFGVVPYSSPSRRFFVIQARACDAAEMERLPRNGIPDYEPVGRLALVMETGLSYCPGCGADLAAWIDANDLHFRDLLAKLGRFVLTKWEQPGRAGGARREG